MRNGTYPRDRANAGFSLTELMIAISVMGLLIAIGVPAYGHFMQSWRLNGEANQMATMLRAARNAAVTKNTDVVFAFDQSEGKYFYIEDTDGDGKHSAGEFKSGVHTLENGIQIGSFTTPKQWIVFGPKGNTIDGGTISFENSHENTKTIRVYSGTGNVTVE